MTFSSQDLNLIHGGPAFRREWLDRIIVTIDPMFNDTLLTYQKVVLQRNRYLKALFEKGRLTVSDQDALAVWDTQLANYGAKIIKRRLSLLSELTQLLPNHKAIFPEKKKISLPITSCAQQKPLTTLLRQPIQRQPINQHFLRLTCNKQASMRWQKYLLACLKACARLKLGVNKHSLVPIAMTLTFN